jgi:hypothetical protein
MLAFLGHDAGVPMAATEHSASEHQQSAIADRQSGTSLCI